MIRAKWLLVGCLTFLLLFACRGPVVKDLSCGLSLTSSQPSKSDTLTIALQVDGTPSMQGYVTNSKKSRYAQTLELLDSAFLTSGSRPKTTVQYYRLGTSSQSIKREAFREAQKPNFYDGSDQNFPLLKVSQIEAAITPPDKGDKLSVIITDLYQKDADTTLVSKKIKDSYLNKERKGYAVGIWGIRSEFNGTVYDVGLQNSKFTYTTQGKQFNQFHPFYVIFIGPYTDIVYYFDKLCEATFCKDSQFVIFSADNLVSKPSHLQGSPQLPQGLNRLMSINDGNVAVEVKDKNIELLEVGNKEEKELKIDYTVPFNPLKRTLSIDSNSLASEIKIKAFDQVKKDLIEQPGDSPLKISDWKVTENQLGFVTKIDPSKIQPGVYFFTVDAVAKKLEEQTWWKEWSASEDSKDGAKTNNLLSFLQEIKTITTELMNVQANQPVIGRFCYAIQKK